MLSFALRIFAAILFVVAGCNGHLFNQASLDLIAFGLAAWVVATILDGYGPPAPRP